MTTRSAIVLAVVAACLGSVALAQAAELPDPPLVNWTAPPYWTPPTARVGGHPSTAAGKPGLVSTQADLSNPLPFIPVTPCRLIDTRHGPIDIPAASNRGIFIDGETRTYQFSLSSTCTGLPTNVAAWSLDFQYTTMRVSSTTASYLTAWPAGGTMPSPESTLLGYGDRWTANSAIIPGGSPFGSVSVYAQHGGDVIIDVNGYYSNTPASGGEFDIVANNISHAIYAWNQDESCSGICGIVGTSYSIQTHSFAVGGMIIGATDSAGTYGMDAVGIVNTSTGYKSAGVRGEGQIGVVGITSTSDGYGVIGESETTSGVLQSYGILGVAATGVYGYATSSTAATYGVYGEAYSTVSNSAGVYGKTSAASGRTFNTVPAGVMGDSSTDIGVYGVSQFEGVTGDVVNSSGVWETEGVLGFHSGGTYYGVFSYGNTAATGTNSFIEPHPLRVDSSIHYVCLEGPEAGTYFRGRGRFVGHSAVIAVPEDFRLVTDPEGLSVQVTPIGEIAGVAVVSVGLDQITLKSSGDVEFFYTVNGVRHTQTGLQPIVQDNAFMPRGPDETIPGYLNAAQKQMLIANGTYNEDGTVNMQTAARLGWTKVWRDREEAVKASVEKAAAQRAAEGGGQGQPGQRQ